MDSILHFLNNLNIHIQMGNLRIQVINIARVPPSPEWRVSEHAHRDCEFHIIPSGRGNINVEGTDFEVRGGELYITGPLVRHTQVSDPADPMTEYCMECDIGVAGNLSSDCTFSAEEGRLVCETLSACHPCVFSDALGISARFEELIREAEEQKPGYFLKIQTLVTGIMVDLMRTVLSDSSQRRYQVPEKNLDLHRVNRLVNFVEINLTSPISLEDISRTLFLSPKHINRLVKKHFNLTFHQYLLQRRFMRAKRLLQESTLTIEQVSVKAGFSSHFYMYQVFKRLGEGTPAEIRQERPPV